MLGLSLLRLGDYVHSEEALTYANILDNLNPQGYGYLCILCLTVDQKQRRVQADYCFQEAIRRGLVDKDILEEIGDLYMGCGEFKHAEESYKELLRLFGGEGEVWQKLGDVMSHSQN